MRHFGLPSAVIFRDIQAVEIHNAFVLLPPVQRDELSDTLSVDITLLWKLSCIQTTCVIDFSTEEALTADIHMQRGRHEGGTSKDSTTNKLFFLSGFLNTEFLTLLFSKQHGKPKENDSQDDDVAMRPFQITQTNDSSHSLLPR